MVMLAALRSLVLTRPFTDHRLERRSGTKWQLVRNAKRATGFRGSNSLTVKQLFGSTTIEIGHYRVALSAGTSQSPLGFKTT